MTNILCFGDSNTWGYNPVDGSRYDEKTRWTGVLQGLLGTNTHRIIEEGLNGRTTNHNEAERPIRSGLQALPILLESHRPLDWVIVMLGTNDFKTHFKSSALEIVENLGLVCDAIQTNATLEGHPPHILLVSPTGIDSRSEELPEWFRGADQIARDLPPLLKKLAASKGIDFMDAAEIIEHQFQDGLHWSRSQHFDFAHHLGKMLT